MYAKARCYTEKFTSQRVCAVTHSTEELSTVVLTNYITLLFTCVYLSVVKIWLIVLTNLGKYN